MLHSLTIPLYIDHNQLKKKKTYLTVTNSYQLVQDFAGPSTVSPPISFVFFSIHRWVHVVHEGQRWLMNDRPDRSRETLKKPQSFKSRDVNNKQREYDKWNLFPHMLHVWNIYLHLPHT